mmetsp:Transcript_43001/g.68766  ORF Transcript_43001/g.68766 Transcript_43001/m.68766 type:complete len:368 (+) Transcript_43001:76-1179(+)
MDVSEADTSPVPLSTKFFDRGITEASSECSRVQGPRNMTEDYLQAGVLDRVATIDSPVKKEEMSPSRHRVRAPAVLAAVQRQMEELEGRLGYNIEEMQQRSLKLQRSVQSRQAELEGLVAEATEMTDCSVVDGSWSFRPSLEKQPVQGVHRRSDRNDSSVSGELVGLLGFVEQRIADVLDIVDGITRKMDTLRNGFNAHQTKLADVCHRLGKQERHVADLEASIALASREEIPNFASEDSQKKSIFSSGPCNASPTLQGQTTVDLRLSYLEERLQVMNESFHDISLSTKASTVALTRQLQDAIARICSVESYVSRGRLGRGRFRSSDSSENAEDCNVSPEMQVGAWKQQACRSRWSAVKLRGRKLRC